MSTPSILKQVSNCFIINTYKSLLEESSEGAGDPGKECLERLDSTITANNGEVSEKLVFTIMKRPVKMKVSVTFQYCHVVILNDE